MERMLARLALALASATAWGPTAAPAQPPPDTPPTSIVVRPAAEPRPALKYRLVPERIELVPGNAAIFYHRGLRMMSESRARLDADRKAKLPPPGRPVLTDDEVSRWVAGPIAEIPVDRARTLLGSFGNALHEVELAAIRTACDWEYDRRGETLTLPLPEIQEMRSLARLVALQARLAILDGKPDEAVRRIETGLTMGRHVARGPIVIQALVGVSVDFVMTRCLEDLIQAPGAPSLYWALADRPRPTLDMREPLEGERYLLEKVLPGLTELDRGIWGLDQARRFADELQRTVFAFDTGDTAGGPAQRLGIAAMTAKVYPEARRALIAAGRAEAEVEAMPVVQVSALYSYREYARLRDDSFKWMNLPYWQSFDRVEPPGVDSPDRRLANPLLAMFRLLSPGLNASRLAALRLDRQLDALQCVEAIRLHVGAAGGNKLPASLDALTGVPVPIDLLTGRPFDYRVDGDSATLSAPAPPGSPDVPALTIRYALKLSR